jgi:hypothetical protein
MGSEDDGSCFTEYEVHPVNEYRETEQKLRWQVGWLTQSFLRFRASQPGDFRQLWAGDSSPLRCSPPLLQNVGATGSPIP